MGLYFGDEESRHAWIEVLIMVLFYYRQIRWLSCRGVTDFYFPIIWGDQVCIELRAEYSLMRVYTSSRVSQSSPRVGHAEVWPKGSILSGTTRPGENWNKSEKDTDMIKNHRVKVFCDNRNVIPVLHRGSKLSVTVNELCKNVHKWRNGYQEKRMKLLSFWQLKKSIESWRPVSSSELASFRFRISCLNIQTFYILPLLTCLYLECPRG